MKKIGFICLALLLFIPLVVTNSTFFPYIVGKNALFRLLAVVLIGVAAILVWQKKVEIKSSLLNYALLVWVGIFLLADIFAVDSPFAFTSNFERMEGWFTFALLVGMVIAIGSFATKKTDWMKLFMLSLGVGFIVDVQALMTLGANVDRIAGALGNPIYLAIYNVIQIGLAGWLLVIKKEEKTELSGGLQAALPWLAAAAILINLISLYFTATRSALLGLIAGLVIAAVAIAWRGGEYPKLRKIAIGGLSALVILIGLFFALRNSSFVQDSYTLKRVADISLTEATSGSRLMLWDMSLEGVAKRPILGYGQEGFSVIFTRFYNPELYGQEEWFDRAHNVYIDMLVAGGVLGLIAYLAVFILAFWTLYKHSAFSLPEKAMLGGLLVAYAVNNIFVFDNITSYIYFFLLLSMLLALGENRSWSASKSKLLITPIAIIGVIALLITLDGWVRSQQIIDAFRANMDGKSEETLNKLTAATDTYGIGTTEAAEQMTINFPPKGASMEQMSEYYQEAQRAITTQIQVHPETVRMRQYAARLYAQGKEFEKAEEIITEAIERAPRKPSLYFDYGNILLSLERQEDALDAYKSGYDLNPDSPKAIKDYAIALLRAGREQEAQDFLSEHESGSFTDDELIQLYRETGNFDGVLAILKKRYEENPDDPQAELSLSAGYFQAGRIDEAIAIVERMMNKYPEFSEQGQQILEQLKSAQATQ